LNGKRAPFSFRVKNATDIFYESAAYIKTLAGVPLLVVCSNTTSVVVTGAKATVWRSSRVSQLARELLARRIGAKTMKSMVLAIFTLIAVATSASASPGQEKDQSQKSPAKQKQSEKTASMTGCVDQQEGRYVLTDDRHLAPIADLEADGFPTEGFAKHVGHKVTVRGTNTANGSRPLFKVRTVETLSETCAPQPAPQGRK
jgi:hypothetical protein